MISTEEQMKNAAEVAHSIPLYAVYGGLGEKESHSRREETYGLIAKALQDAYQKGAEDMRIAAAKVAEKRIVHNARLDYDAGWNRGANLIEDEIRHLPLHPEGGGR